MKIILGSASSHKIAAVQEALKRVGRGDWNVEGIQTDSGQNEQPVGFDEIFAGAMARAAAAHRDHRSRIAIGIESGILRTEKANPRVTLDIAVVVILAPGKAPIISTSQGVQFPEDCVDEAERRGFQTTTVGSIIKEKHGGDGTDPHSTLTHRQVTRTETLTDALVIALRRV